MREKIVVSLLLSLAHVCNSYSNIEKIPPRNTTSDDVFEYVLLDDSKHPCTRTCLKDAPSMVCKYVFTVEWYHTLSKACFDCPFVAKDCFRPHCLPGDGVKRPALVVNRQMPGPDIQVCLGDEIVVDVENLLPSESTTVHWHGLHQSRTPYMDGVPFVTQCPISPGGIFRYRFKADRPGTHFWHSHTGFQRADGSFGALIVRVPEEDNSHRGLYDYDLPSHAMIVMDWGPEIAHSKFIAHHHSDGDNKPETLLVNGLGRYELKDSKNNRTAYSPVARFIVKKDFRYRFRVINAEFLNCPIEISVDNHTITVISSDGNDFVPVRAESLVTYAGERFDFVVFADQPVGLYWIRFRGLMDCDERFKKAKQVAILQYEGASDIDSPTEEVNYENAHKEGLQVNALNKGPGENGTVSVAELESLDQSSDPSLKEIPDHKFYISYDFYKLDNPRFHVPGLYGFHNVTDPKQQLLTPQLNHISLKLPPFSLLSERELINPAKFCNASTVKNCIDKYCECMHILEVPLNSTVELLVIDKGFAYDANHPFHLHGHAFRVVGMQKLGKNTTEEEVKRLDESGAIQRNLLNPPTKDTVTVPDGGLTVLRFHASNPGYWLFHCHIEFHVEIGMALVFKVGDHSQMLPVPRGFPRCGNYLPDNDNETSSISQMRQTATSIKISILLIALELFSLIRWR